MSTTQDTQRLKIRAAERAFGLVEALALATEPTGLIDLSQRMQLAPATVHRMLVTLTSIGWVEQRGPRSGYQLSEQMLGIAALALANNPLVRHGRSILERLSARTKYNSYLTVLEAGRVVFLATAKGEKAPRYDFQVGLSIPAYANPAGKVLLAYLPEDERRELLDRYGTLRQLTPATVTDIGELEKQFETIRAQGYFVDPGESALYRRGVAMPVRGADHKVGAAVLNTIPVEHIGEDGLNWMRDEIAPLAAELTEQLGGGEL